MVKYINKKRIKGSTLKERDLVYLLRKNIKTKRLSEKFNHIKLRPFIIKEKLKAIMYRLILPKDIKIYLVFYVSLLESTLKNTKLTKLVPLDNNIDIYNYKVKDVLKVKLIL